MKPLTKRETRREHLRAERWLRFHGDPSNPRFAARQARKALA